VADRLDQGHGRLGETGQQKEGRHAVADEFVAHGRGGEPARIEFDHSAAAWTEVVPEDAGS
jgi:hypothetical protein